MKKLLTICLIMATVFTVNAQELNFDETVKYIKDNLIKYKMYQLQDGGATNLHCSIDDFKAKQNGEIVFVNTSGSSIGCGETIINLFEKDKKTGQAIEVKYEIFWTTDHRIAFGSNFHYQLISSNASPDVLTRLAKAFNHLRSLCKKEKDPFDD